mgnify:CR=1 FL=1
MPQGLTSLLTRGQVLYKVLNGTLIHSQKCEKESERGMAIKVARKIQRTPIVEKAPEPKKEEKKEKSRLELLPDDYKDEVTPREIILDETGKLVISVKRGGDYGLPHVDIRHFVTTERFTGFTKKGVNFPLEFLYELMDLLHEVSDECDRKGLE